jgi:general secretion pathway protein G
MSLLQKIISRRGFTLIELLAVMMILGILASIAVPSYKHSVIKARETILSEDLYQMRRAIDAYYADRLTYPETLENLVQDKYLYDIPVDPFTRTRDSWQVIPPEADEEGRIAPGGVFDVHSGSDIMGLDGRPYQEW